MKFSVNLFKKPVFRGFFIGIMSAILIPFAAIISLFFWSSTSTLSKQLDKISQSEVNSCKTTVDLQVSQKLSSFGYVIENPDLWELLYSANTSAARYFKMNSISKSLSSLVKSSPDIVSIYVYIPQMHSVITDTSKYNVPDFYDYNIFEDNRDIEKYAITPMRTMDYGKVFSIIGKFKLLTKDSHFYIAINIDYDAFYVDLTEKFRDTPTYFLILDDSEKDVFSLGITEPLDLQIFKNKAKNLTIEGNNCYAYYNDSKALPLDYILILRHRLYRHLRSVRPTL